MSKSETTESQSTFWNDKHKTEVELLALDIPSNGKVTDKSRPELELWRKYQNAYYDAYNNGCINWAQKFRGLMSVCKRTGHANILKDDLVIRGTHKMRESGLKRLEQVGDAMFDLAIKEFNNV